MHGRRIVARHRGVGAAARALALLAAVSLAAAPPPAGGASASPPPTERVAFASLDWSVPGTVPGRMYRPDGPGPFPAVVLLHGCDGIGAFNLAWASWFRDAGYVALVVDSLAARHTATGICIPDHPSPRQQALDGYGALQYLRTRGEVAAPRIAVIG